MSTKVIIDINNENDIDNNNNKRKSTLQVKTSFIKNKQEIDDNLSSLSSRSDIINSVLQNHDLFNKTVANDYDSPFNRSDLRAYLKTLYNEEQLDFLIATHELKKQNADSIIFDNEVIDITPENILATYIKPGAPKEINIEATLRNDVVHKLEKIITKAKTESVRVLKKQKSIDNEFDLDDVVADMNDDNNEHLKMYKKQFATSLSENDIFAQPKKDISNMLVNGPWKKFVNINMTTNITDDQQKNRYYISILSFIFLFIPLFILFILLHYYQIEPFNSRYWRFLLFIPIIIVVSFYLSAKRKV